MKKTQEYLESKGIHGSQQRIMIMDFLIKNPVHPTVDEIFSKLSKEMPTLSKTTVYNTLKLLSEKGAISVVNIEEKNARFDATVETHAHFQCTECGKIYDVALPEKAEAEKGHLGCNPNLKDFIVKETQIYHKGICPKCKTLER